ncbi:MAG: arylesterase [Xanthobacteraceae bacterium]|nr:arylesterase [Xanthobacteraceae bacterium]
MQLSYGALSGAVERLTQVFLTQAFLIAALLGTMVMTDPAAAQTSGGPRATPIKLAVLGDSLTAGYGLPSGAAFPARLQLALKDKGIDIDMVNAGVSGDTTSGGRDRLDWSIPQGTQAVIVELGANDMLRGVDPKVSRAALDDILKKLKARNIAILLCGMYAPPNYGADYAKAFNGMYPELAKAYNVPLYPFFLDGVAGIAKLNQPDGLHPTADGVDTIVKQILPTVEAFLKPLNVTAGTF